jgi:formate dehydrogenase major subunit
MNMKRRTFLTSAGATGAAGALGFLGLDLAPSEAWAQEATPATGKVTTTICPYCGVGCGLLVTATDGVVINTEGDPDHPINQGSLCAKGSALYQVPNNERRLTKVKYRAANATEWEEKDWDWALDRIAEKIKATRDATFVAKDASGRVVNRTEGIACMGGAALDNEECYTYSKLARALGVVFLEHQARI